jgi:hypothetical protein
MYGEHHQLKVPLCLVGPYTALHQFRKSDRTEIGMNTATITQAQGLRQQVAETIGKIRAFAIEMYQAHGGWFVHDAGQPASVALARRQMLSLASEAEQHSPALSAELRNLASK